MDPVKVGHVTDSDVYMDGGSIAGRVADFSPEQVGYEMIEHKTLGMMFQMELPGRTVKPLKAKIKFAWLDEEIMRRTALPNQAVTFQFQSYVDIFNADGLVIEQGHRLITTVDLLFGGSTVDGFKSGEGAGEELECTLTRLIVTTSKSAVPIREMAVFNNINRVDGKDVWPRY